ncbi:LuxR C-terminal-related transcriptional regulator [Acidipropionibacterium jensenii]|uniref:LuxR C-terminal-related transcriptional regulator n=1 Tax=Acidipropionibacterium jensenii TaxID=1749 RepID=UPI00214AC5C6|nr:LuxR C-terminal-related transcriptional regulator [Acidipropionibacterium jensenii]
MHERTWPFEWLSPARQKVLLAAASGDHRGLVVLGRAGHGKTSLARQWLRDHPSGHMFAGTAAAQAVPAGAFIALLGGAAGSITDQLRTAGAVLSTGERTRIAVDDAHLLDPASASFLHHVVVEHLADVLVTVRAGHQVPDAVRALWKDELLPRVDLLPLSRAETAQLCTVALGAALEPSSVERIHAAARGNPLFLRHLIETGLDTGELQRAGALWRLERLPDLDQQLDDFIAAELSTLSPAALEAAALVAIGEPLRVDDLVAASQVPAIEEAETAGVIELVPRAGEVVVRLAHPLHGKHLHAHLGRMRARRLRGLLMEAALSGPQTSMDPTRVALLSLSSDHPAPLDFLQKAARHAMSASDLDSGEQIARAAVDRGGGFPSGTVLAHALSWQGRGAAAEELLSSLQPTTGEEFLAWSSLRITNLFWALDDPPRARAALDAARAAPPTKASGAAIDAVEASMALYQGDLARAHRMADQVLEIDALPPPAVVRAATTLAIASALSGSSGAVASLVERVRAVERRFDTGFLADHAGLAAALASVLAGPLPPAATVQPPSGRPETAPRSQLQAVQRLCEALQAGAAGDPRAAEWFSQAAAGLHSCDVTGCYQLAQIGRAEALALAGRSDAAQQVLEQLTERRAASGLLAPMYEMARAAVKVAAGQASSAIAGARRAASLAIDSRQTAVACVALHRALRYGDSSVVRSLVAIADQCEGPLPQVMAIHARALCRHDPELLESASRRFADLGFRLLALDAAIHAAEEFDRQARTDRQFALRSRIDDLDEALGRPCTVAALRHRRPLPLTEREREVARLVGRRLSSREIADLLGVSVRTIEGHVYHCCMKLNLNGKRALERARIDAHQ